MKNQFVHCKSIRSSTLILSLSVKVVSIVKLHYDTCLHAHTQTHTLFFMQLLIKSQHEVHKCSALLEQGLHVAASGHRKPMYCLWLLVSCYICPFPPTTGFTVLLLPLAFKKHYSSQNTTSWAVEIVWAKTEGRQEGKGQDGKGQIWRKQESVRLTGRMQ